MWYAASMHVNMFMHFKLCSYSILSKVLNNIHNDILWYVDNYINTYSYIASYNMVKDYKHIIVMYYTSASNNNIMYETSPTP